MQAGTRTLLKVIATGNLIVFLIFLAFSLPMYWRQLHILRTWPAVEAEVTRSAVVEIPTRDGGHLYDTYFEFAYSVDGQPYTGAVSSSHQSIHRERKEKQAAGFPQGSRHPIRYNPEAPGDIRIQVGYNVHFFAVPIFISGVGAVFGVIALVLFVVARKRAPDSVAG